MFEPIPSMKAADDLEVAAKELRGLVSFLAVNSEILDRRELAADALTDLANNLRGGVSRLVRSDSGAVFIDTEAIDLEDL